MTQPRYWQVAAGSDGRAYSEDFLRFGMAFVGGATPISTMKSVRLGDVLVLKDGVSSILAAGEVVERDGHAVGDGDKDWLRDFDGWDLQAYCYVAWRRPTKPVNVRGLTRTTIQQVHKSEIKAVADELLQLPTLPHSPEPSPAEPVSDEEILEFLIRRGLRPGDADDLTATLRRIRLLAEYYYRDCKWTDVREHETRTFLIVPLLLALGWAEQQIKIEYPAGHGRIDLACFSEAQHIKSTECQLILESKDFSSGLYFARDQVRSYAQHFPTCRALVVSNGYCYKVFDRTKNGEFSERPTAYLNVTRPRSRYPLDPMGVDGALGLLERLLPRARL